ncbi:hypothetical protein Val02_58210 [Virgisporangium aliadipatigenens]|uniref:Phosphodiesterase n=1 Tax=Virgisporangium aliadipatigenens TaxID=741659 RepID=A0A8J3YS89_9ACTN|nr:phosphodiesterase [Virgisporangium aliadipatigenens]GIJ48935.1 hypothetical protein Val02_58210 [Virgisporangium aliadipatigenens]
MLDRLLFSAAAAVARLRHARVMHPRGRSFSGELAVRRPEVPFGAGLLDRPARYRATVRLSKGTPTPRGWPDVLGLAVRVHTRRGPRDLLLSSSGARPLLRHLFLPRRRVNGFYGSLAGYRTRRHGRLFLGAALDTGRREAILMAATRFGRWRPFARLRVGRGLSRRFDTRLAFDPIGNTAPDLRPVGVIQRLRGPVYRGSQRGRKHRLPLTLLR